MPANNKYLYDETKGDWFRIALESDIQDSSSKDIVFVVADKLDIGRQRVHITVPFDCIIDELSVTVLESGERDLFVQVQKSTDFTTWTNILNQPLVIRSGQHKNSNEYSLGITEINNGEALTLDVLSDSGCENLSLNIKVIKK